VPSLSQPRGMKGTKRLMTQLFRVLRLIKWAGTEGTFLDLPAWALIGSAILLTEKVT